MTLVMVWTSKQRGVEQWPSWLQTLTWAALVRIRPRKPVPGVGSEMLPPREWSTKPRSWTNAKLMRFVPVRAVPDIDQQGHAEFRRALHTYANAFVHRLDGVRPYLEDQLVVDLHQHVGVVVTFS